jgi:hypothetical protein
MIESVGLAFDYVRRLLAVVATDVLNRYSDLISPLFVYPPMSCYCAVTALTRVWQVFASIVCARLVIEEGVIAQHQRRHDEDLMSELQTACYHCYRCCLLYVQPYMPASTLSSRSIASPARSHRPSTSAHSIRSGRES